MSERARHYRGNAEACRRVAASAKCAAARRELLMLALKYDVLARYTEALKARTSAIAELTTGYEPPPASHPSAATRQH
jgi:hypothetical protein